MANKKGEEYSIIGTSYDTVAVNWHEGRLSTCSWLQQIGNHLRNAYKRRILPALIGANNDLDRQLTAYLSYNCACKSVRQ